MKTALHFGSDLEHLLNILSYSPIVHKSVDLKCENEVMAHGRIYAKVSASWW